MNKTYKGSKIIDSKKLMEINIFEKKKNKNLKKKKKMKKNIFEFFNKNLFNNFKELKDLSNKHNLKSKLPIISSKNYYINSKFHKKKLI